MFEEVEDDKGYKYFIRSKDGQKKKDHPMLIKIIKLIKSGFSDVRYSSYRVVLKLRKLQKELNTACISYRMAVSIIHKHKKLETAQESVDPRQLTDIIYDIFYASDKSGLFIDNNEFQLETAVSILTNFFWNIFDRNRTQNITMMELKITLLALCDIEPANAYHTIMESHYDIVKDFNRCITKPRFEEFINIFSKILSYLGEPIYFEPKVIADILTEAFSTAPGFNGIGQDAFYNLWMDQHATKFSSYTNIFLLLIRFKKSKSVIHQNNCVACNKFPIVGLRYKCQKCHISLCFECFSKGFTSKRHSLGHRYYELSSCEKDHGFICAVLTKISSLFRSHNGNGAVASINQNYEHIEHHTKLIEDEHIELTQVDDDMDISHLRRRGTIREEIFINSENLLIQQRDLMDKFLSTIENLKIENEKFSNGNVDHNNHSTFLDEQIEIFSKIHDDLASTINRTQSNNTIRPFSSPTKSIFLPSSTPYAVKEKTKITIDPILAKSINGYEISKLHQNNLNDLSSFFITKVSSQRKNATNKLTKKPVDESERDDNITDMLKRLKDLIKTVYGDDAELNKTVDSLSQKFHQVNIKGE